MDVPQPAHSTTLDVVEVMLVDAAVVVVMLVTIFGSLITWELTTEGIIMVGGEGRLVT